MKTEDLIEGLGEDGSEAPRRTYVATFVPVSAVGRRTISSIFSSTATTVVRLPSAR